MTTLANPSISANGHTPVGITELVGASGKVLCIDDSNITQPAPHGNVKKGHIYHVAGVRQATGGLYILGYPAYDALTGREVAWRKERFKPVGRHAPNV